MTVMGASTRRNLVELLAARTVQRWHGECWTCGDARSYLDQGKHDLASITKQVNAIRHGSKRLRQQHGVGYYFVNKSDMAPPSAYSYAQLITRLRGQTKKFR